MDLDEIAVASPASNGISSASDDPLQSHDPPPQANKIARQVRYPEGYAPPSGNDGELKDDLSDFGFAAKQVKGLMSTREFYFDATMQRPQYQTREDRENERRGLAMDKGRSRRSQAMSARASALERPAKRAKVKGEKAEGLVVEGTGNWVLFDPLAHGFPMYPGGEAPALFRRYTRYEPGNARIVEINLETCSVRLKTTPDLLEGKTVEYTKAGPKLVAVETVQTRPPPAVARRRPGRPCIRGSCGGTIVSNRKEAVGDGMKTRAGGVVKAEKKTIIKTEPMSDESGSESPLTDIELDVEIGDSQEGDVSLS